MQKIVIGILPQEKIRARMLAVAKGDYKPKDSEPKVWFTSMKSLAEVLSDKNRELINIIATMKPESLQALAEALNRPASNLSRTLKILQRYGFVQLQEKNDVIIPVAKVTEFEIHAN